MNVEATEGMELMMAQMMQKISECMQALEELKETNAHNHAMADSSTESEVDGRLDESGSH